VLFTEIVTALGAAMSSQSSDAQGEFAWAYQEKLKGLSSWTILGSSYGGWQFNTVDWGVTLAKAAKRNLYPRETSTILFNLEQLKSKPFFYKGVAEADQVFTTSGSDYAQTNRNRLLAEMVPALSNAVGANPLNKFAPPGGQDHNFDMPSVFKNGWPSVRNKEKRWLHSDIKTIGNPYIYLMYDKIVELGELNK
jgi:hypothetical protein